MSAKVRMLATGRWSKEQQRWQVLVALPETARAREDRKPPKAATRASLLSWRKAETSA